MRGRKEGGVVCIQLRVGLGGGDSFAERREDLKVDERMRQIGGIDSGAKRGVEGAR